MTAAQQQEFDWPRERQRWLMRNARLPDIVRVASGTVSAAAMRAVLDCIYVDGLESDGVARLKYSAIAAERQMSDRTVKRSVEALEQMGALLVERRRTPDGYRCNHYRICWANLSELAGEEFVSDPFPADDRPADDSQGPQSRPAKCHGGTGPSDMVSEPSDMVSAPSDMVSGAKCHGGTTYKNTPGTNQEYKVLDPGDQEPSHQDLKSFKQVPETEIRPIAARLFRAAGYTGRQGETFWKAAALLRLGWITEAEAMSAATAATLAKSSPPGYFRVTLAELVRSRGGDLTSLMRAARIVPRLPREPPPEATRPVRQQRPVERPRERTQEDLLEELVKTMRR